MSKLKQQKPKQPRNTLAVKAWNRKAGAMKDKRKEVDWRKEAKSSEVDIITVYWVSSVGKVTTKELNLSEKYEYHNQMMDVYCVLSEDKAKIVVVESYGSGAVKVTYWKSLKLAQEKSVRIKDELIAQLQERIDRLKE